MGSRWHLLLLTIDSHFLQRPCCTQETFLYKNMGVISYKDFVYEMAPEFLRTQTEEIRQTDFCTSLRIYENGLFCMK